MAYINQDPKTQISRSKGLLLLRFAMILLGDTFSYIMPWLGNFPNSETVLSFSVCVVPFLGDYLRAFFFKVFEASGTCFADGK